MIRRAAAPLALLAAILAGGARTARAQTLELTAESRQAHVGDVLAFRARVRLEPGQELIDPAPRSLLPPVDGVRIISADTLRPAGDGMLQGQVRMAFYRIGLQPVPTMALLYRRRDGAAPDTLVHQPISVEIVPILPAGNPDLKDIKPLAHLGGPVWWPVALLLGVVAGGLYWLTRRRRPAPEPAAEPPPLPVGPFERALGRLDRLAEAAERSGNGTVPLYADVAAVVRECLLEAGALPHPGLTTREVVLLLPEALALEGRAETCGRLLSDADLVKFAGVHPDAAAGRAHLALARSLLTAWRAEGRD